MAGSPAKKGYRRPFARPMGLPRALPIRSKNAPWFLKAFGSKPVKRQPEPIPEEVT